MIIRRGKHTKLVEKTCAGGYNHPEIEPKALR
jgi:hypothetical protein